MSNELRKSYPPSQRLNCSWGRYPRKMQALRMVSWRDELTETLTKSADSDSTVLPYGRGRSYGDVCLNSSGELIDLSSLNRVISFDKESGIISAEAGITLREILELIVPNGWFLPVTPGTSWVTLGGAIANDVHGKNHHREGTFGRHISSIEILRNRSVQTISLSAQPDLFRATIGGLGLTGIMVSATIRLKRIASTKIVGECTKFESLDEFFEISSSADSKYEYTVAWLDCLNKASVRGQFMAGNHAASEPADLARWSPRWELAGVPLEAPSIFVQPWSMHLFNFAYYHRKRSKRSPIAQSFEPFFYPLDVLNGWNKLYGANGFFQFQCVVPHSSGEPGIRSIIDEARKSGAGSFLCVLKEFGDISSPGMLSFPRPGYTLCLDFANRGSETLDLLKRLEDITVEHSGVIYPAKDAVMSVETFQRGFPRFAEFAKFIEPGFNSDLWQRVKA